MQRSCSALSEGSTSPTQHALPHSVPSCSTLSHGRHLPRPVSSLRTLGDAGPSLSEGNAFPVKTMPFSERGFGQVLCRVGERMTRSQD